MQQCKNMNLLVWKIWFRDYETSEKRLPLGLVPVWRCDWLISALYDWVYPE